MKGKMIIVMTLFIAVIAIVLSYQWGLYHEAGAAGSKNVNIAKKNDALAYQIEINVNKSMISVEQVIDHVDEEVVLKLPKQAENVECSTVTNTACNTIKDGHFLQVSDSSGRLTLSYQIKTDDDAATLLEEWHIVAVNEDKLPMEADFRIILLQRNDSKASWVGPIIGEELNQNKIQIIAWEAEAREVFPLYKTAGELRRYSKVSQIPIFLEGVEVDGTKMDILQQQQVTDFLEHAVVIFSVKHPSVSSYGLAIINEADSDEALFYGTTAAIKGAYRADNGHEWIYSLLAGLMIKEPLPGQYKTMETMRQKLIDALEDEERTHLLENVLQAKTLTPELLDEKLSKLKGMETSFFREAGSTQASMPLIFKDNRSVYIDHEIINQKLEVLYFNHSYYFPIEQLAAELGYRFYELSQKESYLLSKNEDSWRFYIDEAYFIYNEEGYGLTKHPVQQINGKIFLPKSWYEEMLHLKVVEGAYSIDLYRDQSS